VEDVTSYVIAKGRRQKAEGSIANNPSCLDEVEENVSSEGSLAELVANFRCATRANAVESVENL
jgi:hypothetical protein